MDEPSPDRATLAGFFAVVVLIGLNFVAVRTSNMELAPFWGAASRYALATVLIVALVVLRGAPLPRGRAFRSSMLFGTLNFAIFFGLMYWALVEVAAGAASVVLAAVPLFTFLMTVTIRLERFTWRALIGAAVVIVGIGIVSLQSEESGAPPLRMAAVIGAALATAAAGIVVKRMPRSHPLGVNAVGMATGAVLLLAVTFVAGDPLVLPRSALVWGAFVYLILSSILLFVLLVWLIGRWTASGVAYAGVLAPIVTIVVAHVLMDEAITWRLLVGGVLVALGVYLGALKKGRSDPVLAGASVAPAGER